jgi:hypothetical protein
MFDLYFLFLYCVAVVCFLFREKKKKKKRRKREEETQKTTAAQPHHSLHPPGITGVQQEERREEEEEKKEFFISIVKLSAPYVSRCTCYGQQSVFIHTSAYTAILTVI